MVDMLAARLQTQPDTLEARVEQLTQDLAAARRQIAQYQRDNAQQQAEELAQHAQQIAGVQVVAKTVDVPDDKVLREMGDMVRTKLSPMGVVVLASNFGERIGIQVNVDPALTRRGIHDGELRGKERDG